jgi:hypothetical protein
MGRDAKRQRSVKCRREKLGSFTVKRLGLRVAKIPEGIGPRDYL